MNVRVLLYNGFDFYDQPWNRNSVFAYSKVPNSEATSHGFKEGPSTIKEVTSVP